ncbi:MAG: L-2-amino-thiazoline-4-carboxylic acid hydrolase [Proteobacteria bacterium]|nr:L-2-amino-thiazoline-4-carboxylic acid hydrolase [Pseudomonadota bacterium]
MSINNSEYYEIENYWVDKETYCTAFFERAARNGKKAVFEKYGREKGQGLMEQTRSEFLNLLPRVPYVGEIDIMRRQMLLTVIFTSLYRVLKETEKIEEIWMLCRNFNKASLMGMPRFVRWLLKRSTFSQRMKNSFKKLAEEHKRKNLADQWDFVAGDGKTFDWGMNMTQCAKVIFLNKIGAAEFSPYVCLIDKNFAECCRYGLKRTSVLAEGADHCDFRLSKNGPVNIKTSVSL